MTRVAVTALLLLCTLTLPLPGLADEASEHLEWGRWSFDYEVKDNTGLALRNVTYSGEQVLAKASMPVVRVKYVKERRWWNPFTWFGSRADSGRCGPFPRPAALAGSGPDCELRRPEGLCREFQSERGEVVGTRRLRQDRRIPYLPILAPIRRRRNTADCPKPWAFVQYRPRA